MKIFKTEYQLDGEENPTILILRAEDKEEAASFIRQEISRNCHPRKINSVMAQAMENLLPLPDAKGVLYVLNMEVED